MRPMKPTPPEQTPFGRLDEGALAQVLGYQIVQANLATLQLFASAVGRVFDLRPVEFTVLALVDQNPGLAATQLAKALAMTPPNAKQWIDRLQARGLLQREPHATDGRALHIRATKAGSALCRKAVQAVTEAERQGLPGLSAGEHAILLELLHKVARNRTSR